MAVSVLANSVIDIVKELIWTIITGNAVKTSIEIIKFCNTFGFLSWSMISVHPNTRSANPNKIHKIGWYDLI